MGKCLPKLSSGPCTIAHVLPIETRPRKTKKGKLVEIKAGEDTRIDL
jgi:hypothetical protein